MECERVREEFVERLTGNLSAERSRAIDDHLAGCSACRAETERMRELWAELGTLRMPASGGAAGRVGRLIEARTGGQHTGRRGESQLHPARVDLRGRACRVTPDRCDDRAASHTAGNRSDSA